MRFSKSTFVLFAALMGSQQLVAQSSVPPATTSAMVAEYAHAAEVDPLTDTARQQRKEAMSYAQNDQSSHILLCVNIFQQMQSNHAANAHEIALQYLISAAAFLYQHPDAASDSKAQNIAGIEAALNVYDKFLATDSKTRSKFLDGLDKQRAGGKLKEYLAKLCK